MISYDVKERVRQGGCHRQRRRLRGRAQGLPRRERKLEFIDPACPHFNHQRARGGVQIWWEEK